MVPLTRAIYGNLPRLLLPLPCACQKLFLHDYTDPLAISHRTGWVRDEMSDTGEYAEMPVPDFRKFCSIYLVGNCTYSENF